MEVVWVGKRKVMKYREKGSSYARYMLILPVGWARSIDEGGNKPLYVNVKITKEGLLIIEPPNNKNKN